MTDTKIQIMQALDSDTFIEVRMADGKRFKLIPYEETKDGDQQPMDRRLELNRIAACITALDGLKTEAIVRNLVGRLLERVNVSMVALKNAQEAIHKIMGGANAQSSQTATSIRVEDQSEGETSNDTKNH